MTSPQEYFSGNQIGLEVFSKKYMKEGETDVEDVFSRVAGGLSNFENNPSFWKKRWLTEMMDNWYRPAGSILNGVGSDYRVSLANCTTVGLPGDSIDSIMDTMKTMMKCAAARQGLGVDVSNLRPSGAKVNNSAKKSTGTVPWMDFLQSMGHYVGQNGRLPAVLLSLKVDHPDIESFIKAKTDLKMINNANISVQISDDFMWAVYNNEPWELSFETKHEKIKKVVNAKDIFDLLAESATSTAEPGVQFIDQLKNGTMVHQIYLSTGDKDFETISSNACSEKFLANLGVCLLGSINVNRFSTKKEEYINELQDIVPSFVRLLDNAISYELENNLSPVDHQRYMVEMLREIGVGVTNIHAWVLRAGYDYDSKEGIDMIEDFMKTLSYQVFSSSLELAKEKGSAGVYDLHPQLSSNDLMGSSFFKNIVDEFYGGDSSKVGKLRNLALMSIAPTGSLSMTFSKPALSFGIESAIGMCYWRKTRALSEDKSYDYYFVFPTTVKEILMKTFTSQKDIDFVSSIPESTLDPEGKYGVEIMNWMKSNYKGDFKPAHLLDPLMKIDLMSRVYRWVDAAVSVTFNLPTGTSKSTVAEIYMKAWEKGVRAVSVYVDGSREGILVFEPPKDEQTTTTTHSKTYCKERPNKLQFSCAPKRGNSLPCELHHCKVKGVDWLVLVGLLDGYPYEIFAGESNREEMPIPASAKTGKIIKKGKGTYSLVIEHRGTEIEFKDISKTFMNVENRALTRLLSISLRHGVRPVFLMDQLKKSDGGLVEFSSVVSRVLSKYMKILDYDFLDKENGVECEYCGGTVWTHTGGCKVCAECGKGSRCD